MYVRRILRRGRARAKDPTILAFSGQAHAWHVEQCTVAEFCAYIAVGVKSHIELAAEARIKPPSKKKDDAEIEDNPDSGAEERPRTTLELVDVGGGCDDDIEEEMDDVSFNEVSNFPVHDPESLVGIAL